MVAELRGEMTATVPPLPPSQDYGVCPWCSRDIFDDPDTGLPLPVEKCKRLVGHTSCPFCKKAIHVTVARWGWCEDDLDISATTVSPERSETDKRYMAMMGISDDHQPKRKKEKKA